MATQYGQPRETDQQGRAIKKGSLKDRRDKEPEAKPADPSPSGDIVRQFHKNAAVDTAPHDIHHTLGHEPNQASPGDHSHDGGTSPLLIEGMQIVGSKQNPSTVLPSIIAILVRLGAKNETT